MCSFSSIGISALPSAGLEACQTRKINAFTWLSTGQNGIQCRLLLAENKPVTKLITSSLSHNYYNHCSLFSPCCFLEYTGFQQSFPRKADFVLWGQETVQTLALLSRSPPLPDSTEIYCLPSRGLLGCQGHSHCLLSRPLGPQKLISQSRGNMVEKHLQYITQTVKSCFTQIDVYR